MALATLIGLGRLPGPGAPAAALPVLLAATVGEEGLGDLRGIRAVLDEHDVSAVVALEGHGVDSVVTVGIASARYVVTYRGPGGHSWRDRDRPSARARAVRRRAAPRWPRARRRTSTSASCTGGLSVNSIAGEARMEIDVRAETDDVVDAACGRIEQALRQVPRGHRRRRRAGRTAARRPAPRGPSAAPRGAPRAHARGAHPAREDAASTDANAALGRGIPAVTLGLTRGAGIHREDEWIELAPLAGGAATVFHLIHRLAGLPAPRGLV